MREIGQKEKTLINNTVYIYLLRLCNYIFPLITIPFLTRVLGDEMYGTYAWANSVNTYLRLIVDFGFVIYGIQAIASVSGDKKKMGETVYGILICKLILVALTGLVLICLILFIPQFNEQWMLLLCFFGTTVVGSMTIDYVFQGIEKMQYITVRTLITKAIFTCLVFLFVRGPNDLIKVPLFTLIGDSIVLLLMWRTLIFKEKIRPIKCSLKIIKPVIIKSNWFFASRVFGAVYTTGNTIALGLFCTKTEVAQYNLAYSLISICQNILTPIGDSVYPYMVKYKNMRLVKKIVLIVEPMILAGCALAWFFSPPIINLVFGGSYITASSLFKIMLPIIVITLPGCMFGFPILSAFEKHKEANIAVIIAGIIHFFMFFVFKWMGIFGIYSLSIMTVISELLVFLIRVLYVSKYKLLK